MPAVLRSYLTAIATEVHAYWRIYLLAAGIAFGAMIAGWDIGLIGGVLVMKVFQSDFGLLNGTSSPNHRLAELNGNIVSVLQGGCFLGAVAALFIPSRLGLRWTLILSAVVFHVGSIIQVVCLPSDAAKQSTGLPQLYIGRAIGGWGIGLSSAVGPVFLSEMAPTKIRARITGCWQFFGIGGIAFAFWTNYAVFRATYTDSRRWRLPFAMQMIPGVVFLIAAIIAPESPRWLFDTQRDELAARKALAQLYCCELNDARIEDVIHEMRRELAAKSNESAVPWAKSTKIPNQEPDVIVSPVSPHTLVNSANIEGPQTPPRLDWRAILGHRMTVYRMSIPAILWACQQLTGTNSLNYYSPQIFRSLGVKDDLLAVGIYGIVKLVASGLANVFVAEQIGRKWSLIISGLGQALCMFWIGAYLRFRPAEGADNVTLDGLASFTIVTLYLLPCFYALGWTGVPWVAGSELGPSHTQLRTIAMAIAAMVGWAFNAFVGKVTPLMLEGIKYGTFLFFAAAIVVSIIWVILFMPEPSGWPLEHIDFLFENRPFVAGCVADLSPRKRQKFRVQLLEEESPPEGGRSRWSADIKA